MPPQLRAILVLHKFFFQTQNIRSIPFSFPAQLFVTDTSQSRWDAGSRKSDSWLAVCAVHFTGKGLLPRSRGHSDGLQSIADVSRNTLSSPWIPITLAKGEWRPGGMAQRVIFWGPESECPKLTQNWAWLSSPNPPRVERRGRVRRIPRNWQPASLPNAGTKPMKLSCTKWKARAIIQHFLLLSYTYAMALAGPYLFYTHACIHTHTLKRNGPFRGMAYGIRRYLPILWILPLPCELLRYAEKQLYRRICKTDI